MTLSPVSPALPLTPNTNVIREPSPAHSSTGPTVGTAAVPDSQPQATTGPIEIGRTNADTLNTPSASVVLQHRPRISVANQRILFRLPRRPSIRQLRRSRPRHPRTRSHRNRSHRARHHVSRRPRRPWPRQLQLRQIESQTVSAGEPSNRAADADQTPLATSDDSSPNTTAKPLAAPAVAQPATPVATPEFPAVIDDPFAPLVSPSPVPGQEPKDMRMIHSPRCPPGNNRLLRS